MRLLEATRSGMQFERVAKEAERAGVGVVKEEDVRLSRAQPVEPDSALKL